MSQRLAVMLLMFCKYDLFLQLEQNYDTVSVYQGFLGCPEASLVTTFTGSIKQVQVVNRQCRKMAKH